MIHFKDFVPEVKDKGGIFRPPVVELFAETLIEANTWLAHNKVDVVNIETVVLPNIHSKGEEGSVDTQLHTAGEMGSYWHQFIRVWYQSA